MSKTKSLSANSFLKIAAIVLVTVGMIVGILGIRDIISTSTTTKGIITCVVLLGGSVTVRLIHNAFGETLSEVLEYMKVICILSVFAFVVVAILSIRDHIDNDIQRKAYSTIGIIFVGSMIIGLVNQKDDTKPTTTKKEHHHDTHTKTEDKE